MERIYREVYQKVARCRRQKHATRCKERQTLFSILYDIKELEIACQSLSDLLPLAITPLIAHWQQRNNADRTIYLKLMLLKKYFKLKIDQKILAQYKSAKQTQSDCTKSQWPFIALDNIDDPLVHWIAKTQILFGLKYREVITLCQGMLFNDGLRLLRAHTFNHCDRFIPVVCTEQSQWILDFKAHWQYQLQLLPYHILIKRVKGEYQRIGLPNVDYFRYQYAIWRYNALLDQPKMSKRAAMCIVRKELGVSRNEQVRAMLTCLKKC